MRKQTAGLMVAMLALVVVMLAGTAQAAGPYYWDNDGATPGFGTPAAGTWAAPATGNGTQGWSTDSTGASEPVDQTTTTTDTLHFGNGETGLGAGTITVSGTVDAGDMTFASGSGSIVLSGGTITLADAGTITVDNSTDTIRSILAGAATSLTKAGTGTLVVASTTNTYSGTTVISDGTLSLGAGAPISVTLTNPSFETDAGIVNSYQLIASLTGWTDDTLGTYIEQGTNRTFAPAQNPNYNATTNFKWAALQNAGTLSQTFNAPMDGNYTVSFAYAGRPGSYGPLHVKAQVDTTDVTSVLIPSQATWTTTTGTPVFLTAGSHTLNFVFTNPLGGDKSSVLDAVTITGTALGLLPANTPLAIASGARFDLNGNAQNIASLGDSGGGGGVVTNSGSTSVTLTINPSAGSTTFNGTIGGTLSLVKSGIATQVLAGASAYTGGTLVGNGALLVDGSITGTVSVVSGATLGGTGTITGSVTYATGALALFATDAPLTFTGPVTLSSNTVHLALPDNLADGTYLLATNTTADFTGVFAAAPVIDSGFTSGSYRTIITKASAVWLIVSSTPIILLSPSSLPVGTRFAPYSQTITASGGTSPYTNTVVGSLPSGLTLSPEGLLSGTPDAIGTYNFTVQAMDALGYTGTRDYSVTIQPDAKRFFWTNTVSSAWSVAGNWTNDVGGSMAPLATGQTNYTLDFNKGGTYTATSDLDSGFLLNRINFSGATVTLAGNRLALTDNGATMPQVNQNSAVAVAINNYLILATNVTMGGSGGGGLTLGGVVSGAGSLTKTNSGTLTLSGNNSFTGGTTISGGSLTISANANLGASGSRNLTFAGSATLNGFTGASLNALVVNGGATATFSLNTIVFASTSGSGNITYPGANNANVQLDLGNASAFTGTLRNNIGGHGSNNPGKLIQFTSLGDGVGSSMQFGGGDGNGSQAIRFRLYGDAGPLTMANRQVRFYARTSGNISFDRAILQNDNTTPANKWVIIPNLANTTDRTHFFELRGSNTGNNEFAGAIINSTNG